MGETHQALNTIFNRVAYPVMALIGQPYTVTNGRNAAPGILQTKAGRILAACYLNERSSQNFRLLAIAQP